MGDPMDASVRDGYVRLDRDGEVYCEPISDFERDAGVQLPAIPDGMAAYEYRSDGVLVFYDRKGNAHPRPTPPGGNVDNLHFDEAFAAIRERHAEIVAAGMQRRTVNFAHTEALVEDFVRTEQARIDAVMKAQREALEKHVAEANAAARPAEVPLDHQIFERERHVTEEF